MTTLANRVKPWALDLRSRPLLDYVVILGVVFILSGLGIVMVFSSSMAVSALQDDSPWSRVVRQGVMVVVGFIAMWMGLRVRPQSIDQRLVQRREPHRRARRTRRWQYRHGYGCVHHHHVLAVPQFL